jgi:aryl-alcohol dehydrogenase-like predicted oxidoreductase
VTQRGIDVGIEFSRLAKEVGLSAAQLAVVWSKEQPGITAPLIGPRTVPQLESLLEIMEAQLDPGIRAACDELVPPGSAVANFHNTADWMKAKIV